MHSDNAEGLIAVLAIYVLSSGIPTLFPRLPVPGTVLEILGGVLLGPQLAGLIHSGPVLNTMSGLGLSMLFLMAGFEVDLSVLRGPPLKLALWGWLFSAIIAAAAMLGLAKAGIIHEPLLTALAICTTAIGALLPILRDAGLLAPPYGPLILAIGAAGEACPVILLALVVAGASGAGVQSLILIGFAVIAVISVIAATRLSAGKFGQVLERTLAGSGQLPVRLMIALAIGLALASETFGIDGVLGAFLAGSIARAAMPHHLHEEVETKLAGVGYGFMVPLFFINAGAKLDFATLIQHPAAMLLVPAFAILMLAARGAPVVLLYRKRLPGKLRYALALHSGTQLPLVVAIASVGMDQGLMPSWQGAALVSSGLLSLILFPICARALLPHAENSFQ